MVIDFEVDLFPVCRIARSADGALESTAVAPFLSAHITRARRIQTIADLIIVHSWHDAHNLRYESAWIGVPTVGIPCRSRTRSAFKRSAQQTNVRAIRRNGGRKGRKIDRTEHADISQRVCVRGTIGITIRPYRIAVYVDHRP